MPFQQIRSTVRCLLALQVIGETREQISKVVTEDRGNVKHPRNGFESEMARRKTQSDTYSRHRREPKIRNNIHTDTIAQRGKGLVYSWLVFFCFCEPAGDVERQPSIRRLASFVLFPSIVLFLHSIAHPLQAFSVPHRRHY